MALSHLAGRTVSLSYTDDRMVLRVIRPFLLAFATLCAITCSVRAESPADPSDLRQFLGNHCLDCHAGSAPEAGLDLEKLSSNLEDPQILAKWIRIHDRVVAGEMPPADWDELAPEQRSAFVTATDHWLRETQQKSWRTHGRVRGRRLTNIQLERTLQDLLGVDIPLKSRMPEEPRNSLFTTEANSQPMSHFQLQQHLSVVDIALDEAFRRALVREQPYVRDFTARQISRTNPKRRTREPEIIDDLAVVWSGGVIFYGRLPATTAPVDGWYRFHVRAKGLKTPADHGVWCSVRSGKCVSSAPLLNWVTSFEATDEFQDWTFQTWIPAGHMLEIRPGDQTLKKARFAGGQIGSGEGEPQNVPGVAIQRLEMERIHLGPDTEAICAALFGDLEVTTAASNWSQAKLESEDPQRDLQNLMRDFATRAFRRPILPEEIEAYVELASQTLADSGSLASALRVGYRSLLCSPRFLYHRETPGDLGPFELASRLSYFLWNRPPDATLLELAATNQLLKPSILRHQVRRMLAHPNGQTFVKDFGNEWLDLRDLDFTTPDRRLFPAFDFIVQHSMLSETQNFLQDLLDHNRSVTNLIHADYTFLNERLARFYGIENVFGDEIRRVDLSVDDHRGGLLTQGAIMKVTANGTATSPVVRGVWVSERLLGEDIPPPPANVPAIEPDVRGAKTIREMLEKHKSDTNCAACHRNIDPPGFALENFDPAGQWRDRYRKKKGKRIEKGSAIDTSYQFADGETFDNLQEFQKLVCNEPETLAGNLAEKLVAYGTGTAITFADRSAIADIVTKVAKEDFGFRSIIEEVVASRVFLSK
jgi:mono/diheme cytochrome c family protein